MSEVIINFALIIAASLYCGVLVGRRGVKKAVERAVYRTLEEQKAKQQELATELHGELGKIRESIIVSARAYQNAVRCVEEKLAPPSGFTLGDSAIEQLPQTLSRRDQDLQDEAAPAAAVSTPYVLGSGPAAAAGNGKHPEGKKAQDRWQDDGGAIPLSADRVLPGDIPPVAAEPAGQTIREAASEPGEGEPLISPVRSVG